MSPDLDDLLCTRYPQIFGDRHETGMESAMSRGFTHGDGWFRLVDTLCSEIQRHVERDGAPAVRARQVKEKLGTLRFYYCGGDDFIAGMVSMAQGLSGYLCEECGAPGRCWRGGLIATLCPAHAASLPIPQAHGPGSPRVKEEIHLPFVIHKPGWRHLADALKATLDNDARYGLLPPAILETVIETEALAFRWRGGDGKGGRAAGILRLLEAYSLRCDRLSGFPVLTGRSH